MDDIFQRDRDARVAAVCGEIHRSLAEDSFMVQEVVPRGRDVLVVYVLGRSFEVTVRERVG